VRSGRSPETRQSSLGTPENETQLPHPSAALPPLTDELQQIGDALALTTPPYTSATATDVFLKSVRSARRPVMRNASSP